MRIAALTRFTRLVIVIGLLIAAIAISEGVGLQQKWEDGVTYTVVLFGILIVVLRPAWGRPRFWQNVVLLFALHVAGMIFVLPTLPLGRFGVPKIIWSIGLFIEGFLLLTILWRSAAGSKPHT
jgi:hypothetical protein